MAKPRIFVSSTYYDLRHIRNSLETFIERFGYEPVLFENGSIPFNHNETLINNCYSEVSKCHMLVLIIGGRYGSSGEIEEPAGNKGRSVTYNSVTKGEYERAKSRNIPIFIFVERGVKAEYETFKQNRGNSSIRYAHVDDVNVFGLLDEILVENRNNFVREFDRFDDMAHWLTEQWAGLFAEFLVRETQEVTLKSLENRLSDLAEVTSTLKRYSESIISAVEPSKSEEIISRQEKRLQHGTIRRFSDEHLIAFLKSQTKASIEQLFEAAKSSPNFTDFTKAAGITELLESPIFSKPSVIESADRDYSLIRQKYFSPSTD